MLAHVWWALGAWGGTVRKGSDMIAICSSVVDGIITWLTAVCDAPAARAVHAGQ
jgi:hypothetical protein